MKKAKIAIATPESDARLRKAYNDKGAKACLAGLPRTPPCDPNSMIGGWWFEGYDRPGIKAGLAKAAKLLDVSAATIRLHAGEMSAQEMRSVRAVLDWKKAEIEALINGQ